LTEIQRRGERPKGRMTVILGGQKKTREVEKPIRFWEKSSEGGPPFVGWTHLRERKKKVWTLMRYRLDLGAG